MTRTIEISEWKEEGQKKLQSYTIRNAESRRNRLLQEGSHKQIIQCQRSTLKTYIQILLYELNRIYLEIFKYIHIYIYYQLIRNEVMNVKEEI